MENKRILKKKIAELEETIESKNEYIRKLRSQFAGEHICTGHCSVCTHNIMAGRDFFGGICYLCDLETNCKDFERK